MDEAIDILHIISIGLCLSFHIKIWGSDYNSYFITFAWIACVNLKCNYAIQTLMWLAMGLVLRFPEAMVLYLKSFSIPQGKFSAHITKRTISSKSVT